MKPEQVHSIRESFAEISRLDHVAALVSYRRLFKLDPALRSLFTLNIEDESRKLMDILGALIAMLERPRVSITNFAPWVPAMWAMG
ncbi:MAG: Hemin receptor [Verrucomicrobiaceae bacterium]|nr:Hemin receptor [Verrucomicrobiaceae bacterium]